MKPCAYGFLVEAILKVIADAKDGISSAGILEKLAEQNIYPSSDNSLSASLSFYKRTGLIYAERYQCKTCARWHNISRLAEKGKMKIAGLKENA